MLEERTLQERAIAVAEFREATELAVVNSVRGWRRAALLAR